MSEYGGMHVRICMYICMCEFQYTVCMYVLYNRDLWYPSSNLVMSVQFACYSTLKRYFSYHMRTYICTYYAHTACSAFCAVDTVHI